MVAVAEALAVEDIFEKEKLNVTHFDFAFH